MSALENTPLPVVLTTEADYEIFVNALLFLLNHGEESEYKETLVKHQPAIERWLKVISVNYTKKSFEDYFANRPKPQ